MNSQVIIVLPCYNEEKNLYATCHSLGFGVGEVLLNSRSILIIVDNNSTDATKHIANEVQRLSPKEQVYVITQKKQGIIPARKKGNQFALSLSKELDINMEEVLILQTDADTIYPALYMETMKDTAERYGKNYLFEACVDYTPEFRQNNNNYIEILEQTDSKYEKIYENFHDYIVDDKVVAYWLSDYLRWGEHSQEFMYDGDEILAETTRLFLKGVTKGAKRQKVESVKAFHSGRKIIENASLQFATAGFPRETAWNNFWTERNQWIDIKNVNAATLSEAIYYRSLHLIALFLIIPLHVDRALIKGKNINNDKLSELLLNIVPTRNIIDLQNQPGLFFTDTFTVIQDKGQFIKEKVEEWLLNKV